MWGEMRAEVGQLWAEGQIKGEGGREPAAAASGSLLSGQYPRPGMSQTVGC